MPGRLLLAVGLPGSGKTTTMTRVALDLGAWRVCPDELLAARRISLWDETARATIEGRGVRCARWLLARGATVVLEYGFWTRPERAALLADARAAGAACELWSFSAPLATLVERAGSRDGRPDRAAIPAALLTRWAELFEAPDEDEGARFDRYEVVVTG